MSGGEVARVVKALVHFDDCAECQRRLEVALYVKPRLAVAARG